jgi:hypothetical protein
LLAPGEQKGEERKIEKNGGPTFRRGSRGPPG